MIFTCPVCRETLQKGEKTWVCPNGHSYDVAKEGYVHLLPVQKMHSKIPGDTKEMVAARRNFLESGGYGLFRDALCELVWDAVKETDDPVILDAGCGEGYYLRGVESFLKDRGKSASYYGFDISKFAVKAASKRQRSADFAVGSIFEIPVADGSADCLINIFAPMVEGEFRRVMKSGGTMIFAVPGVTHLYGLKEILYEDPYENPHKETEYEGFRFVKRQAVTGELRLTDPEQIRNLFAMTPYYWKTPVEGSRALRETSELVTDIEFDFLVYEKL